MKKPEKLMNAGFLILIAVSLITALGFNMITTLISSYAVSFGTELTAVGLISGIFFITALFFRPVGGFLSDFLNKKRICVYTTFLIALVIVFYALSPTVSILLVMRVLHGALFGINGTANMALATEFIPDDHMGEGLGYYGLGSGTGTNRRTNHRDCDPGCLRIQSSVLYHSGFYAARSRRFADRFSL